MTARVVALHHYPVKGLLGEAVPALDLQVRGAEHDRSWCVRTADGLIGSGKRTRRFTPVPGLLEVRAVVRDGRVIVVLPDGRASCAEDPLSSERLSEHVGRPVVLERETATGHHDDGPVSLLALRSVAAVGDRVEPEHFRANLLLAVDEPYAEDRWVGTVVRVGAAVLRVTAALPRCVVVDAATAELPARPGVLRAVGDAHDGTLGVVADVLEPGRVAVGDEVVPSPVSAPRG